MSLFLVTTSLIIFIWAMWPVVGFTPENVKKEIEKFEPKKPICRFPSEYRDPKIDCVKPIFRKDGKLDPNPDLAAAQARWVLYKQQEDAMNAWESEFWEGNSPAKTEDSLEESLKRMTERTEARDKEVYDLLKLANRSGSSAGDKPVATLENRTLNTIDVLYRDGRMERIPYPVRGKLGDSLTFKC